MKSEHLFDRALESVGKYVIQLIALGFMIGTIVGMFLLALIRYFIT